jgi:hypothetical protein
MKIENFTSSAIFSAIHPFVPKSEISDTTLDTAHEIDGKIYFVRTVSDSFCDESSQDAFNVTTFKDRDAEQAVYLTPRKNSIFNGEIDDVVQLHRAGYKVYAVEEYEHSAIAIRLVSKTPIRTQKAISTGSFRNGVSLECRWDSSFAFFVQPKSWSAPTDEFLSEFASWMNGYSYSYEVMCATPVGKNDDGEIEYAVEVLDDCRSYYSDESAKSSALHALENWIESLETAAAM